MSFQYKAGLVVFVLAWAFFVLAKPLFLQFMSESDFKLRRNAWLTLNAAAFVAPSVWLYFGAAALILLYAGKRDSNPAALFLFLLMAMAPYRMQLPTLGLVGQVFPMDHFRVMALALALPVLVMYTQDKQVNRRGSPPAARTIDICVLVYCGLQIALLLPYASLTDTARRSLLLCLDVLLPYFMISRTLTRLEHITEAAAALALSIMLLAPAALFEMATRIMLWGSLQESWSAPMLYVVLMRGGLLRAQATAGHSIVFGLACALALIVWLSLLHRVQGKVWRWGGSALLFAALLSSFSRGPWVGAVAGVLWLMVAAPLGLGRIIKILGLAIVAATAVLISPIGEPLLEYLPFVGDADTGTITYRKRLLEISLDLIARDPLTGNPYFVSYMEELRQGQGIIDLVNGIVTIALSFGVITLGAYLLAHGVVIWVSARGLKFEPNATRWLAAGIAAALVAALVTLFTASNYLAIPYLVGGLSALGTALLRSVAFARSNPQIATSDMDPLESRGRSTTSPAGRAQSGALHPTRPGARPAV